MAEEAIAERLRELLGHRLPQLEQLSDPKYPMWLGVFAGTLPIETLQTNLEEIFRSRCCAWRSANSGSFCNPFERENELARSRPILLQFPSTKQSQISMHMTMGTNGTTDELQTQRGRKRERDDEDDEEETARKAPATFTPERTLAGYLDDNFRNRPFLPSPTLPNRVPDLTMQSGHPSSKWFAKNGQQSGTGRR